MLRTVHALTERRERMIPFEFAFCMAKTVFWDDGVCSLAASKSRDPDFCLRAVHHDARGFSPRALEAVLIRSSLRKGEAVTEKSITTCVLHTLTQTDR